MINPFASKTKPLEGNGSLKINWLVHFKILCPGEHTRKLSHRDLNPGSNINISELLFTLQNYHRTYTKENEFTSRIKLINDNEKFRNKANFKILQKIQESSSLFTGLSDPFRLHVLTVIINRYLNYINCFKLH